MAYTPGVAEPCKAIAKDPEEVYTYTAKSHMVGVISDGSAVLGLGNIGADASLPVMEGKCVLFKEFGGIDAFPIAVKTQETPEIIRTIKNIAPMFGGINLEDIAAPRCFEIEDTLKEELDIPVFHDDQHGTAIVVAAGLKNTLALSGWSLGQMKVVINGAGAAGIAIARLLADMGADDIIMLDSKGTIYEGRENLNEVKADIARDTNKDKIKGGLKDALEGAHVFIGVSKGNLLEADDIRTMAKDPVIFALANPIPEIYPEEAKKGGARFIATGRSDFPNQVNNVLAFPGIFNGALRVRASSINEEMKHAAVEALAGAIEPSAQEFIPDVFTEGIADKVADAVAKAAVHSGVARIQ